MIFMLIFSLILHVWPNLPLLKSKAVQQSFSVWAQRMEASVLLYISTVRTSRGLWKNLQLGLPILCPPIFYSPEQHSSSFLVLLCLFSSSDCSSESIHITQPSLLIIDKCPQKCLPQIDLLKH